MQWILHNKTDKAAIRAIRSSVVLRLEKHSQIFFCIKFFLSYSYLLWIFTSRYVYEVLFSLISSGSRKHLHINDCFVYIHDSARRSAATVCSDFSGSFVSCTWWDMLGKPRCRFEDPIVEKSRSSCQYSEFPAGKDHFFGFFRTLRVISDFHTKTSIAKSFSCVFFGEFFIAIITLL